MLYFDIELYAIVHGGTVAVATATMKEVASEESERCLALLMHGRRKDSLRAAVSANSQEKEVFLFLYSSRSGDDISDSLDNFWGRNILVGADGNGARRARPQI